jgi:hypothetical protein
MESPFTQREKDTADPFVAVVAWIEDWLRAEPLLCPCELLGRLEGVDP